MVGRGTVAKPSSCRGSFKSAAQQQDRRQATGDNAVTAAGGQDDFTLGSAGLRAGQGDRHLALSQPEWATRCWSRSDAAGAGGEGDVSVLVAKDAGWKPRREPSRYESKSHTVGDSTVTAKRPAKRAGGGGRSRLVELCVRRLLPFFNTGRWISTIIMMSVECWRGSLQW